MAVHHSQIAWSDAQWRTVVEAVQDEAAQARVAASFLPEVGPLPASAEVVPSETLTAEAVAAGGGPRLEVDDVSTTRFLKVQVDISLTEQQMAESDLPSALLMFRRAANVIARVEDALIFNGRWEAQDWDDWVDLFAADVDPVFTVTGWDEVEGQPGVNRAVRGLMDLPLWAGIEAQQVDGVDDYGRGLVTGISDAIGRLEGFGHLAPFSSTLGNGFFSDVNTPAASMVLPRDRIEPWLDGQITRSSTLRHFTGVVVSLSGSPIDIVRATPISVQFLQMTTEPRYVFRVYERFALRIKEERAGVVLVPTELTNNAAFIDGTIPANSDATRAVWIHESDAVAEPAPDLGGGVGDELILQRVNARLAERAAELEGMNDEELQVFMENNMIYGVEVGHETTVDNIVLQLRNIELRRLRTPRQ